MLFTNLQISAADGRCILADENEKSGMEKRGTVAARLHLLFTLDKTFSDLVRGIQFNSWGEFWEALTLFQSWRSSQGISEKTLSDKRGAVLRDPDSSKLWFVDFKSKWLGVCPCQCIQIFMLQADTSIIHQMHVCKIVWKSHTGPKSRFFVGLVRCSTGHVATQASNSLEMIKGWYS